ncbi:hypothetical protein C8Q80DRAFT_950722 [Daedaleopsis nitida]|nr:hypothetical protein C8Q80DRAFT_950722 [Daedaleopsis nitida]
MESAQVLLEILNVRRPESCICRALSKAAWSSQHVAGDVGCWQMWVLWERRYSAPIFPATCNMGGKRSRCVLTRPRPTAKAHLGWTRLLVTTLSRGPWTRRRRVHRTPPARRRPDTGRRLHPLAHGLQRAVGAVVRLIDRQATQDRKR